MRKNVDSKVTGAKLIRQLEHFVISLYSDCFFTGLTEALFFFKKNPYF